MHHVVIYGRSAPKVAELLRGRGFSGKLTPCTTREEAERALPEAEILFSSWLPKDLYPLLTRCRWIQSFNAGVEDLVAAPIPAGIVTTRVVGLFGGYIGEFIVGYMLAHTLKMRQNAELQARREWKHYYIERVEGKVLGLAGLGSIGSDVARRAAALGVRVRGLSRSGQPVPGVSEVCTMDRLQEFCTGLDFLALTLPFTPETGGLFGREELCALNPGAVVINCGRGRVLQDEAVLEGVRSGHLGGAVLDVFGTEPLPAEHPFWTEPGVTVTPHISGPTTPHEVVEYFLQNYARFVKGEELAGLFDPARGY